MLRAILSIACLGLATPLFAQDSPDEPGKYVGYPLPQLIFKAGDNGTGGKDLPPGAKAVSSTATNRQRGEPLSTAERRQLRELAQMPRSKVVVFSIPATLPESAKWDQWAKDLATRIETLEKSLKGSAADAETFLELAEVYETEEKCMSAWSRAAELFRQRIQAEPRNGWLHAQLADALLQLRRYDEAAREAEEAVNLSPDDWRCWRRHAAAEIGAAAGIVWGGPIPLDQDLSGVLDRLYGKKLSAAALDRIESHLAAFAKAMDRMVVAGPNEPGAYRFRANRTPDLWDFVDAMKQARGEGPPSPAAGEREDKERIHRLDADLAALIRLEPDDPDVLASHVLWQVMLASSKRKNGPEPEQEKGDVLKQLGHAWKDMSTDAKKIVRDDLQKLEVVASKGPPCKGGIAAKNAAIFSQAFGEPKKAEELARLLVELEPKWDGSWDLLEWVLAEQNSEEADDVSLKRLQANDTARNHYLQARCLVGNNDAAGAEREVRAGLKKDPANGHCQLGLAALLLNKSDTPENVEEARRLLKSAHSKDVPALWADRAVLEAIAMSLDGDVRGGAFLCANILDRFPDNDAARKALKILTRPSAK